MDKAKLLEIIETSTTTDNRPQWLRDRVHREAWLYYRVFVGLAKEVNPTLIVELGTQAGCGALHFKYGCPTAYVITVDICHCINKALLVKKGIKSIICDSAEYAKQIKDGTVDILFIDTNFGIKDDPTAYGRLMGEVEAWMPKMAPNGILLFDDIWHSKNSKVEDGGMYGAWKKISKKYGKETLEVMKLHPSTNFGIILL
jgi:hypothetical protein